VDSGHNSFTIGDTVITTDAKTEFEGSGFHGLADLKVGDFAFAEVIKQADGSLLAEEVKKFTPRCRADGKAASRLANDVYKSRQAQFHFRCLL